MAWKEHSTVPQSHLVVSSAEVEVVKWKFDLVRLHFGILPEAENSDELLEETKSKGEDTSQVTKLPGDGTYVPKDKTDQNEKEVLFCFCDTVDTGLPKQRVKEAKVCVSVIIHSGDKIESICGGLLGCRIKGLKFYSQSSEIKKSVRHDLVFESEEAALKFHDSILTEDTILTLMTEEELGVNLVPVLSETEMMWCLKNCQVEEVNFSKFFDGNVFLDDGNLVFRFPSLASLNLFLYFVAGPNMATLGMMKVKGNKVPIVLHGESRGESLAYIVKIVHDLPKNAKHSPLTKEQLGWNWENLAIACDFVILRGGSKTSKVLMFKTKLSLFQFWSGFTAKLFKRFDIFYSQTSS